MKYTYDYATRMPTREKEELSHGITSMENGLIFHVTRIGKYYCKNMKYRIYHIQIVRNGSFLGKKHDLYINHSPPSPNTEKNKSGKA